MDLSQVIICRDPVGNSEISTENLTGDEKSPSESKKILCVNCGNIITDPEEHIKSGAEDYSIFRNPAGIFFRIICFSGAAGCFVTGDYTAEATWFPGYLWSPALCRSCGTHLGWHYISTENSFFGLIADRIKLVF